jgi:hypothetical protein
MEEKNLNKLQDAIRHLPQHEPESLHWEKLNAELDFEGSFKQLIPELPLHEPESDFWNKIEAQLEPVKEPKHFHLNTFFRFATAAAASLLLVFAGWYVLKLRQPEKISLTYSEEMVFQEAVKPGISPDNNEVLQFIQQQCSQLPQVCQKPEFKELQLELAKLNEEHQKIQQQIAVFGEDPALIRNQIKIENLRAAFTKKLIQIIIS